MYNISDTISHLSKLCSIIHTTTGLNIVLFDASYSQILAFNQMDYPFLTHEIYTAYKEDVFARLGPLTHSSAYLHYLQSAAIIYCNIRIQVNENLVFYACVGPILSEIYSEQLIHKIIHELKIESNFREHIANFYQSLPYLSNQTSNTLWLCYHLLTTMPDTNTLPLSCSSTNIIEKESPLKYQINIDEMPSASQIQFNYHHEVKWRNAVMRGDKNAAKKFFHALSGSDFLYRTPANPLRTRKNILFTLNTLCRAAAIDGGADAICVHQTHDAYTIRIENGKTAFELLNISDKIIDEYCHLVIDSYTKGLSPIIAKAINYLYAHYALPLTLRQVATHIHCSEGHLSRTFQAETGKTLGAYLNELRIKQAISIMGCSDQSISDIALAVGFSSYNKFSIEFKKHTGTSATAYLQNIKIEDVTK